MKKNENHSKSISQNPKEPDNSSNNSTRRTTDLQYPVTKSGEVDKRYSNPQFVKQDGTRDMRTTPTRKRQMRCKFMYILIKRSRAAFIFAVSFIDQHHSYRGHPSPNQIESLHELKEYQKLRFQKKKNCVSYLLKIFFSFKVSAIIFSKKIKIKSRFKIR